jgi:hypothetical protein
LPSSQNSTPLIPSPLEIVSIFCTPQLFARQLKSLNAAGLDERQRLEHLDGRSHEAFVRGITGAGHQSIVCVRHRHVHTVDRFDNVAAERFDLAATRCHAGTQTRAIS